MAGEEAGSGIEKPASVEKPVNFEEPANVEELTNIEDPTYFFVDVFGGERFVEYVRIRSKHPWRVLI